MWDVVTLIKIISFDGITLRCQRECEKEAALLKSKIKLFSNREYPEIAPVIVVSTFCLFI